MIMQKQFLRLSPGPMFILIAFLAGPWLLLPGPALTVSADSAGRVVRTGNTVEPRFDHTATLLPDGKVLIAAGMARNGVIDPTAEIYDPHTRQFVSVGKMQAPRGWGVTATLLPDGRVLLAGGASASYCGVSCYLANAELYDPVSRTFSLAGDMTGPRAGASSILLQNGDVLIVGGNEESGSEKAATAELYHSSTRKFSGTGSMHSGGASALLLMKNGKVLALNDAGGEIYDPETGRFSVAVHASFAREKFGVALLPDGRSLIAGGRMGGAWRPGTDTTEIYDPNTGALTPGPQMSLSRFKLRKAVVPLGEGRVLIAGGAKQPEVYDAASNSFHTVTGSRLDCFYFSTATRLSDGEVLIVGGYARPGGAAVNHAWLYQP
jgi:hypothetical protein